LPKKSFWDSRRNKAVVMTTALPLTTKVCSTCAFWAGSRDFKTGGYLEIHPYSKGECQGDSFTNLAMAALATCDQWQEWPVRSGPF
jgi:hypothetical protein